MPCCQSVRINPYKSVLQKFSKTIEIVKNFDLMTDYEEAIHFILDYVEENEHILNCVFDSMGRDQLKRFFFSDFIVIARKLVLSVEAEMNCKLDENFRDFLCHFYTEAIAGMLTEWIQDNIKYSRQTALEYISIIFFESIPNIIKRRCDMHIMIDHDHKDI